MIIAVVGPTGVGKTKLSVELAKKYNGIVINSDAMQVYKELNIGTAKVTEEEKCGVEHYLFDIVSPDENYTVFDYQKDLRKLLEKFKDKNVILVGGTGLYLKAGLFNYEFSERENANFDGYTNEELYKMLEEKNDLEGIHINNRNRMISRLNSTGNNNLKDDLLYEDVYFIGLTTDRKNLYERINKRVDEMIENGLIEEVQNLYEKYGKVKSLTTGIGYKEIINYFEGVMTKNEAIDLIKQRSRKYAKRQYTWFNNQMNVEWFETNYDDFSETVKNVINYIEKNR